MANAADLRIVHAGDLTTAQAFALQWQVGALHNRLQEIAICGGRVVGSWEYEVHAKGRNWWIDSSHTEVAKRFQRRGLAIRLWRHGIARWKPTRIAATVGTHEGLCFLARMRAELAYAQPSISLDVKVAPDNYEAWHRYLRIEAHAKLRELGKAAPASAKQKQLPAPALKAVG